MIKTRKIKVKSMENEEIIMAKIIAIIMAMIITKIIITTVIMKIIKIIMIIMGIKIGNLIKMWKYKNLK